MDADSLKARVDGLLHELTLDEKFSLCAGQGFWKTKAVPRLGIGALRMTDGPRGVGFHSSGKRCTAFPSGIAQAASWDEALLARFGQALGQECGAVGGRMILGPAINIARTPLNGRTFEYFSEDPYLNSRLVVPLVKAVQQQGVAACIKHYAANNQETHRMRISSQVSERALQEIYLPAFRAAVEQADAWSVMAAYNSINGTPACEHEDLLKHKLREQWGFRGFVVTDWFAARGTSSTQACVKGGLGLEMPGKGSRYREKKLRAAFDAGLFSEADIDANLRGLLNVMALSGHLDSSARRGQRNTQEHRQLARDMAVAGITLLKNDGDLLPLDASQLRKIAVLGPKSKQRNCLPLWGGSAGVWPPSEITPLRGLQQENRNRFEFVSNPAQADAVLLFIGLSHRPGLDSEVKDRKQLELPAGQDQLVRDTLAVNPNTVVVLINGSPVAMPWKDEVPAILECWYPGMEGGAAIASVLFGDSVPCGKLPITFPAALRDSPAHVSARTFPGDRSTVHYDEELMVGYRHFDKHGIEPLFPFGHGLSYTTFEYRQLQLDTTTVSSRDSITVTFSVANTGTRDAAETAQLYVHDLLPGDDRPPQCLKGFNKLWLAAGQSQQVTLALPMRELDIFCPRRNRWQPKPGIYEVRVGSSSRDIRLAAQFELLAATDH